MKAKHLYDLEDGESCLAWVGGYANERQQALAPGRPPAPFPVVDRKEE